MGTKGQTRSVDATSPLCCHCWIISGKLCPLSFWMGSEIKRISRFGLNVVPGNVVESGLRMTASLNVVGWCTETYYSYSWVCMLCRNCQVTCTRLWWFMWEWTVPGGWDTGLLPGVTEDAAASTLLLGEQRGLFFFAVLWETSIPIVTQWNWGFGRGVSRPLIRPVVSPPLSSFFCAYVLRDFFPFQFGMSCVWFSFSCCGCYILGRNTKTLLTLLPSPPATPLSGPEAEWCVFLILVPHDSPPFGSQLLHGQLLQGREAECQALFFGEN